MRAKGVSMKTVRINRRAACWLVSFVYVSFAIGLAFQLLWGVEYPAGLALLVVGGGFAYPLLLRCETCGAFPAFRLLFGPFRLWPPKTGNKCGRKLN